MNRIKTFLVLETSAGGKSEPRFATKTSPNPSKTSAPLSFQGGKQAPFNSPEGGKQFPSFGGAGVVINGQTSPSYGHPSKTSAPLSFQGGEQAPFNSPEGGKLLPPLRGGLGRGLNLFTTTHTKGLRIKSAMTVWVLTIAFWGLSLGVNAQTLIDQGACGASLIWELTENMGDTTLTISGNGAMDNWYWGNFNTPWYSYQKTIKNILIGDSVTSIGEAAFFGFTRLTSVIIGNSVTNIGYHAFLWCSLMPSITIPDNVISIGVQAFEGCNSLVSVNIGNGLTNIGSNIFKDCSSLTTIDVNSNNTTYVSENGILFNKLKTTIIQYPAGKTDTTYTIPNNITTIGSYAFAGCINLTSAIIGNSVTTIGYAAFDRCSSLTSITIPNSVTSIGYYAFMNCSSLTSITSLATTPPALGNDAFSNVPKTIPIYIPCGSNSAYKTAAGWSDFTNFIEKDSNTCISGTISPLISGVVVLYSEQNGYSTDTVTVKSDGGYLFDNVANGDYVVKFIPDSLEKYLPTYYGDVEYWDSSTRVTIACNCVDTVNITVLPAPPPLTGNTVISGILYEDDEGSQSPSQKGVGKPSPDVGVSLQRQQGSSWETVARTVTDANGDFGFHVPDGRYRFMVDVPGMELTNTGDTTVQGQDTIKVELTLVMSEETGIKELESYEGAKLRVYPNPANGQLTIDCRDVINHVSTVEIYDVMGRKVGTYQFPSFGGAGVVSSGEGVVLDSQTTPSYGHPSKGGELASSLSERAGGEVIIDISHLAKGLYFLKIDNKVVKFIKE